MTAGVDVWIIEYWAHCDECEWEFHSTIELECEDAADRHNELSHAGLSSGPPSQERVETE